MLLLAYDFAGESMRRALRFWTRHRAPAAWLSGLWAGVKQGIRLARRTPTVALSLVATCVAVVALITLTMTVVDAVLLRPLPFDNPDEVVVVGRVRLDQPNPRLGPASLPEFLDIAERSQDFSRVGAVGSESLSVETPRGFRMVRTAEVSPGMFELLGARASVGRLLGPDDQPGQAVVLGHAFWKDAFGSDPAVIGRTADVATFTGTHRLHIVGITEPAFQWSYPTPHDLYVPMDLNGVDRAGMMRRAAAVRIFARLRHDTTLDRARANLARLSDELKREYPTSVQHTTFRVDRAHEHFFGAARGMVVPLALAVACVLVLGCANVSAVRLAMGLDRSRDLWTRTALGAPPSRLVSHVLGEGLALAAAAWIGGIAVASAALGAVRYFAPPDLPRIEHIAAGWGVVWTAGAASVAVALLSSIPLARQALRAGSAASRMGGGRGHTTGAGRLQDVLVGAQLALVLPMLLCSAVLVTSLRNMLAVDLGFEPDRLVAMRFGFQGDHYGPAGLTLQDAVLRRVLASPAVVSAGWSSELPLAYLSGVGLRLENGDTVAPGYRIVSPGYLETLGATLVGGRPLAASDRAGPPGMVVSRTFADRYFDGRIPVGEQILVGERWHVVVGVVEDLREGPLDEPAAPTVYWPFSAEHWMAGAPWLVARVRGEAHDGLEVLREAAAEAAPGLPLMGSTSLREVIGKATSEQRFLGAALSGMTIIGLILAAVGVFGAAEYALRRRTRELAVRTALGAGRGAIVRTVTQRLAAVVLAAFGLGAVLSVVVVDWLGSLAFGIEPLDARLLASIAAALTALLVVSVVGPVRRALLIDPAVELGRAE